MSADADDFALIESLLYSGGYQRLARHVARLLESAEALGFPLRKDRVTELLDGQAAHLGSADYKIRVLMERDGSLWSSAERLDTGPGNPEIMLAAEAVSSVNELARHKTTRRTQFEKHAASVSELGLADVMFLNERGELAEAANSNVFLELDGELLTPPVTAGILPGVYRQYVLETNPTAREATLTRDDLTRAAAVYLCNSVRGWRQVQVRPGLLCL